MVPAVSAVCRFRGLPFRTLMLPKNDNAASTELACTCERKIREKRERRMVLPSHGVVAKTAWCGIRCSSVLFKSSACKFSEEKTNQIVVTLDTLCKVFVSKLTDFCII